MRDQNQPNFHSVLDSLRSSDQYKNTYLAGKNHFLAGNVRVLSQAQGFFETVIEDEFNDFNVSVSYSHEWKTECSCQAPVWCSHRIAALFQVQEDLNRSTLRSSETGKVYTRDGMIKRVLSERKERAVNASYTIIQGDNIFGDHKLLNQKGDAYKITFRDIKKQQGYCSCSDYATNKLGTCKHLLFAFNHLKLDEKNMVQPYPFVDIFLDPLNNYRISWFYPEPLPMRIGPLMKLYFGEENFIPEEKTMMFFGFVKEAKKNKNIRVRQEVLQKIEQEFDKNILDQKRESISPDYSLISAELYPYQKEGAEFATFRKGVIIADEMGLGKTLQAISAAIFKKDILGFKKTLVVCPASLKSQWKREIERFTSEKAEIIEGNSKERGKIYQRSDAYFLITNYEAVVRDIESINHISVDLVILDEAQQIRNFETAASVAIKSIKRNHSLVITGTPIENKLADIYSITGFIDPDLLAPLWEFSYQHCYFDQENEHKITGYYNLQLLKEKLKPVLIRREKKEVLDQLAIITNIDVPVQMHPVQKQFHIDYAKSISTILNKKFKTPYDWQMLTLNLQNMRRVADSSFLVDKETNHSPKLKELEQILLEKLDIRSCSRKVVIFSEWTTMLSLIGKMLTANQINFVELTGKVPVKDRNDLISGFENDPNCSVFLSTESGGTGLNLQMADTIINFELPWNPAKKNQRTGRIDRLGQKRRNLTVINLISLDSIEMKLISGLMLKQDLFDSVLNSDNLVNEVDFSEKGRFQFLNLLQESINEFSDGKPLENVEVVQEDTVPDNIEKSDLSVAELEMVMNKGLEFLSGIYKLSTGKEFAAEKSRIEIDKTTGEVVLRFNINL